MKSIAESDPAQILSFLREHINKNTLAYFSESDTESVLIYGVDKSAIRLKAFNSPCLREKPLGCSCEICINLTPRRAFPSHHQYIWDSTEGMLLHWQDHFLWHESGWTFWIFEMKWWSRFTPSCISFCSAQFWVLLVLGCSRGRQTLKCVWVDWNLTNLTTFFLSLGTL